MKKALDPHILRLVRKEIEFQADTLAPEQFKDFDSFFAEVKEMNKIDDEWDANFYRPYFESIYKGNKTTAETTWN